MQMFGGSIYIFYRGVGSGIVLCLHRPEIWFAGIVENVKKKLEQYES